MYGKFLIKLVKAPVEHAISPKKSANIKFSHLSSLRDSNAIITITRYQFVHHLMRYYVKGWRVLDPIK